MYELKVITDFAAAHKLQMVGEKCENLHGHNWKVEAFVKGERLNKAGVLMDFGILKKHLAEVMDTIDHKFLNELPFFSQEFQPSSENIAHYIAQQLEERIQSPDVRVDRVNAWESNNACATYIC
jgi:6-pyruvoyltetrahydropterin/6-carboxytetrahydropterin synthase